MNSKFKYFLLLLSAVVFSTALSSCDDDDDDDGGENQNVVELVQDNDDLSTLEDALERFPDLVSTLSGSGQVTVFAPSNAAFENLLDAVGQSSLDDIPDD